MQMTTRLVYLKKWYLSRFWTSDEMIFTSIIGIVAPIPCLSFSRHRKYTSIEPAIISMIAIKRTSRTGPELLSYVRSADWMVAMNTANAIVAMNIHLSDFCFEIFALAFGLRSADIICTNSDALIYGMMPSAMTVI